MLYDNVTPSKDIYSDTGLQGLRYDVKNQDGIDLRSVAGSKRISRSRFKCSDVIRWPLALRESGTDSYWPVSRVVQ